MKGPFGRGSAEGGATFGNMPLAAPAQRPEGRPLQEDGLILFSRHTWHFFLTSLTSATVFVPRDLYVLCPA
jgi:hypothetical protein